MCTILATLVYTKLPCSILRWSITWNFLPQISIALEDVLFKLHECTPLATQSLLQGIHSRYFPASSWFPCEACPMPIVTAPPGQIAALLVCMVTYTWTFYVLTQARLRMMQYPAVNNDVFCMQKSYSHLPSPTPTNQIIAVSSCKITLWSISVPSC